MPTRRGSASDRSSTGGVCSFARLDLSSLAERAAEELRLDRISHRGVVSELTEQELTLWGFESDARAFDVTLDLREPEDVRNSRDPSPAVGAAAAEEERGPPPPKKRKGYGDSKPGDWSALEPRVRERAEPAPSASSAAHKKSRRKRGSGSSKTYKANRSRAGVALAEAEGDEALARDRRLLKSWLQRSSSFMSSSFSIIEDAAPSSTGWQGKQPPKAFRNQVKREYSSGAINKTLAQFFKVSYTEGSPTLLLDKDRRVFFFRSSAVNWLKAQQDEFHNSTMSLLGHALLDSRVQKCYEKEERGPHFACIIGHYRQYSRKPSLTLWHRENEARVSEYLANSLTQRVSDWVSSLVELYFPGVAARFRASASWHEDRYQQRPLFGLYWNLCINAMFPNQPRIHCKPHIDFKNVVGVCVLLIYEVPGSLFDHASKTWLVLWEAGVVIQLPPWVAAIYPSSLFYHFNVDISDFEAVMTRDGKRPTRENSRPLNEIDGRGSLVYFNEASMYQSSETGYSSLKEAKKQGQAVVTDYGKDAQQAFLNFGDHYVASGLQNTIFATKC